MKDVLVLGAGGFLGLNTVRAFLEEEIIPRCGRRARGNVLGLRGLNVPLVVTEFMDPQSLRGAFRGVDTIIHTAAHYPRLSLDPDATLERGLSELDSVLDAAAGVGVRRMIFVSSTATVAPNEAAASTEDDVFESCPQWGTYHSLKWHLEKRVQEEHRLEVLTVCPAACLGPFDWKVGTSALLLATARGVPPAHPEGSITTVDARDVARALVLLTAAKEPPRRLLLANERADAHELICSLAQRYGASTPPPALSPAAARALADQQEEAAARHGGRPSLARELVDLIVHGPRLDTSRSRALGVKYRPLSETLDGWGAWAQRMGLLPRPRMDVPA